MENGRIDNIEIRTRKVEDAIIRFEYIADTLLVQFDNRIKSLEKHDEEIHEILYTTCDAKTNEIDNKVKTATDVVQVSADRYFMWSVSMLAGLFFLFVGALAYEQGEHKTMYGEHSEIISDVREDKTNITRIYTTLDKIDAKVDNITQNQRVMIEGNK